MSRRDALGREFGLRIGQPWPAGSTRVAAETCTLPGMRPGPGPAIAAGANALVEVVAQTVDDHSAGLADRAEHSGIVDEQAGARRGDEGGGRITLGLIVLGRPPLGPPRLEATFCLSMARSNSAR